MPRHAEACQGRVTILFTTLAVARLTGQVPKTPDNSPIQGLDHQIAKLDMGDIP